MKAAKLLSLPFFVASAVLLAGAANHAGRPFVAVADGGGAGVTKSLVIRSDLLDPDVRLDARLIKFAPGAKIRGLNCGMDSCYVKDIWVKGRDLMITVTDRMRPDRMVDVQIGTLAGGARVNFTVRRRLVLNNQRMAAQKAALDARYSLVLL